MLHLLCPLSVSPNNFEYENKTQRTILVWCLSISRNFLYHLFFFALLGNHNQNLISSSLSHYSNNSKLCHISHQGPSSPIFSDSLVLPAPLWCWHDGVEMFIKVNRVHLRVSKTKVISLKIYFTKPKPTLKSNWRHNIIGFFFPVINWTLKSFKINTHFKQTLSLAKLKFF